MNASPAFYLTPTQEELGPDTLTDVFHGDDAAVDELVAELARALSTQVPLILTADLTDKLWTLSEADAGVQELTTRLNRRVKEIDSRREVLELVRASQLGWAVSAHVGCRGTVVVRELIPNLFAILNVEAGG